MLQGSTSELKVYQGKPHGFMIVNGSLATDSAANDAYNQMISFFRRMRGIILGGGETEIR